MTVFLASVAVATNLLSAPPAITADATAAELVRSCRTMVPSDVEIKGRIVLRNRKGIVQSEYGYELKRKAGAGDGGTACSAIGVQHIAVYVKGDARQFFKIDDIFRALFSEQLKGQKVALQGIAPELVSTFEE